MVLGTALAVIGGLLILIGLLAFLGLSSIIPGDLVAGGIQGAFTVFFNWWQVWLPIALIGLVAFIARGGRGGGGDGSIVDTAIGAAEGVTRARTDGDSEPDPTPEPSTPSPSPSNPSDTPDSSTHGSGPEIVSATHSFPSGKSPGKDVNIAVQLKEGDNPLSSAEIDYNNGSAISTKALNPNTNSQNRNFKMGSGAQKYEIFVKDSAGENATETKTFNVSGPSSNLELTIQLVNPKGNEEIVEGMDGSDIGIVIKCENRGAGGLDKVEISFGGSGSTTFNLTSNPARVHDTVQNILGGAITFNSPGTDYIVDAALYGGGDAVSESRTFKVTNKSRRSKGHNMGISNLIGEELTELRSIENMVNKLEDFESQEMKELRRIEILIAGAEISLQAAKDHNVQREGKKTSPNWEEIEKDVARARYLLNQLQKEVGNFEATDSKMENLKNSFEQAEEGLGDEVDNLNNGVIQQLEQHHPAADNVEANISRHYNSADVKQVLDEAFRKKTGNPAPNLPDLPSS